MSAYFRGVNANLLSLYDTPAGVPTAGAYGFYNPTGSVAAFANGTQVWRTTDTDGFIIADNSAFGISKEGNTEFYIGSAGGDVGLYVASGKSLKQYVGEATVLTTSGSGLDFTDASANITKSSGDLSITGTGYDVILDGNANVKLKASGTEILRVSTSGIEIADNSGFNISKGGSTELQISSAAGDVSTYVAADKSVKTKVNNVSIVETTSAGVEFVASGANITKSSASLSITAGGGNDVIIDSAGSGTTLKYSGTTIASVDADSGITLADGPNYNIKKLGSTSLVVQSAVATDFKFGSDVSTRINSSGITLQDGNYNIQKAGTGQLDVTSGGDLGLKVASASALKIYVDGTESITADAAGFNLQTITDFNFNGSETTSSISKTSGSNLKLSAPDSVQLEVNNAEGSYVSILSSDDFKFDSTALSIGADRPITNTAGDLKLGATSGSSVKLQVAGSDAVVVSGTSVALGSGVTSLSAAGALTVSPGGDLTLAPSGGQVILGTSGGTVWPTLDAAYTGTGPNELVTKAYVDGVASGLDPKASVRLATAAVLAGTFSTASVASGYITGSANGALSVDGVAVASNDRILVKNGTTDQPNVANASLANGIWVVDVAGSAGAPFGLYRSEDADGSPANEVSSGMYTYVSEGTANSKYSYILTTNDPITLNTTPLKFDVFSNVSGALTGPGSSTDNAFVTWNGTTGSILKNNSATLSGSVMTFASDATIAAPASSTTALSFTDGSSTYLRLNSSAPAVELAQGTLSFTASSGSNIVKVPTNQAAALSVSDGSNSFLTAVSTTGGLHVKLDQDFRLQKGLDMHVDALSADTTLSTAHGIVRVTGSADVAITLPDATAAAHIGRVYRISNATTGNKVVTISTSSSQLISGDSTPIPLINTGDYLSITSDGVSWMIC